MLKKANENEYSLSMSLCVYLSMHISIYVGLSIDTFKYRYISKRRKDKLGSLFLNISIFFLKKIVKNWMSNLQFCLALDTGICD